MRGVARHGNTPFSVPFISQIDGNLWQGGCKTGLVLPKNIEHVISLYPWESYTLTHEVKSALTIRMYDSTDQGFAQVPAIAEWVVNCVTDGPTLVHCQAGLNRSSLIAGYALVLMGRRPEEAVALLRSQRSPACLCNPAFERWLTEA
jgi:protein-tyrosine phosphatase